MRWLGDIPQGFNVSLIGAYGFTNHRKCFNFSEKVSKILKQEHFDAVVGFNKMKNLDVYYAADPCFKARVIEKRPYTHHFYPRIHTYIALEKSVFDPASRTDILLITSQERDKFIRYYNTPTERFHTLPPGIDRARFSNISAGPERQTVRKEFGITDNEYLLLMVGSSFQTKGVDRSILALSVLPERLKKRTRLFIIGKGKSRPFEKMARRLNVIERVHFLGERDDVARFMYAADLLLHPAYSENTGTVLLESLLSGLPVLATDICGFAFHIRNARAGLLVPSPFDQKVFNQMLEQMLESPEKEQWKNNGPVYASRHDLYSMPEKAAAIIRTIARRNKDTQ
jgi:UDP-glucose:(heptosyl)LPS alpha-1,3-glucosyltransferase